MLRSKARASLSNCILRLVLIYSLLLSGIAPFTLRNVQAALEVSAGVSLGASSRALKKGGKRAGELLVRFRENATNEEKSALADAKGARREKSLRGESRVEKLRLQEGQDVEAVAAELRLNPVVELVEPNFLIGKDETIPNDPRFPEQWGLKNIGSTGGQPNADIAATGAWQTSTGSPTTVIAVIDSGIDFSHPDLKNNLWSNPGERENSRDDDRNGFTNDLYGWDWVTDSGNILDEQGHGTIVAGIIAAQGNNQTGISGVMWRAGLMSLRVLDNTGTGDVADAVEAIDYAVAQGAQVINCSWGTDEESTFLRDAIERAGKRGVVVVTSAGNDGRDIEASPYYPASFQLSNLVSVASTDQFDQLASFSNYGSNSVTIAAPGTDILTTQLGGGYRAVTGTSASAPLVAGVAGLVKTVRPWLSSAGTKLAITDGARRIDALQGKVSTGGLVSASGALESLRGPGNTPPGIGNNGNNNANGNNGGQNPRPQATAPRGTGGTGRDGGFSVDPIPQTTVVPGNSLPNLDEVRKIKNTVAKAPGLIRANLPCADCDPAGGGGGGGSYPPSDPMFSTARTRPRNDVGEPGEDLGSQNFNWSLPLLGLKGRAGLNLSLTLYYNSLVWTRDGSYIKYNADHGTPAPGFRLGMPFIQQRYLNSEIGVYAYMLVMPSGSRVELRQVGSSSTYESGDSSYMQMLDYTTSALVRTKDGTQLSFNLINGELRCTQIKDRNGNYISATYDSNGRTATITDTLNRVINFNYGTDQNLQSITQTWGGVTHTWATFYYGSIYIQPNFPNLFVNGPNYSYQTVLTRVALDDGTYFDFDYTEWGQVWKIRSYAADSHLRNYVAYNLPGSGYLASSAQSDCPRFSQRRDWAENWNNGNESVTSYSVSTDGSLSVMTMPDGTIYKEMTHISGWQKGLTYQTEVWAGTTRKKWTTTDWTQDNTSLSYQLNPRPSDISVYDEAGNRRRTDITYTSYGLPSEVREYVAGGTGGYIRRTYTDYNFAQVYLDRHILGLVSAVHVVDHNNAYVSKITYDYDWGGNYWEALPATATQHDPAGDHTGRGNLCQAVRWDVTDINNVNKISRSYTRYNRTGSIIRKEDHSGHGVNISYADSFADNLNRNTFAYPTTVTDPDNYNSSSKYNYETGAVTRTEDAKGAVQTFLYDAAGRIERVTNQISGAYIRWVYPAYGEVATFATVKTGAPEYFSVTYFDGAGRVRSKGSDNPGSSGGYKGQFWIYDQMGRIWHYANPAEMNSYWAPVGDDAAGWTWTYQTYDWQGRPLLATNPDGSTSENTYSGCGCAGGEQVTARDERGRRKRMTMDVLGRLTKVEELNWNQTVYSTTNYTYNARDQITEISQGGLAPRTFNYDGHGRLASRSTPEQGTTSYTYNPDDTVYMATDARGSSTTFGYNNRHLVTSINYGVPQGSGVAATSPVTFGYDAVGNRTSMNDGLGSVSYLYNTLSQMTSETRTFTGIGSYKIAYDYELGGQLSGIAHYNNNNLLNSYVGYTYDHTARVTGVTGAGYANVSTYASNLQYRAFGLKQMTYGNNLQLGLLYDSRMRLSRWNVAGRFGYDYNYSILGDNSFRVSYADNLYDDSLNRSYDYDHLGRLEVAHTGPEAIAHVGLGPWGAKNTDLYSHHYGYDQYGNLNYRIGWGGTNPSYSATFTNNRLPGMVYDASGNLVDAGGGWTFQYDATGQQTYSAAYGQSMSYDGDRLRGKKTVGGVTTYYLRSSVLGGQVIAEINGSGAWARGYVYLGSQLLALQQNGVYWMHQDPVTKGERITDTSQNIVSSIELDPWGGETNTMTNSAFQKKWYATYEMDENGSYEAMHRRYNRWWTRFEQPDPYEGSYNLTNPQSFNRYAYVNNDPVNFVDPSGLCTFNIVISGVSGEQLKDIQNEITRIFKSGNHDVVFGKASKANGGTVNLSFVHAWPQSVEALIRDQARRAGIDENYALSAFGFTPNAGNGARLGYVHMSNITSGTRLGGASSGTRYGRVGAHEAIQHVFLNIGLESGLGDITESADTYFLRLSETDRYNMSKETAAALSKLCQPRRSHAELHELPHSGGGGGFGGGGDRYYGGGWGFDSFRWLDMIMASFSENITVSATVGSDIHEAIH